MKSSLILIAGLTLLISIGSAEAKLITLRFPGAKFTCASDIDSGKTVGYYENASGYHGFIYDGVNWTTLDFPGSKSTYAFGIDGNKIVGHYHDDTTGTHRGFLYDGVNWTTLDFPGSTNTRAYRVDGDKIVGGYEFDKYNSHGFLYDGVNWTTLDFPGSTAYIAYGIDGDKIVGEYCHRSWLEQHGYLYNGSNWMTLDLPGAKFTFPTDIDGDNIVGCYYIHPRTYSFLYDGANWTTIDFIEATTIHAYGIEGDKIVGEYWDGLRRNGFIYTIPGPPIEAVVEIDPDTLNLNSKGKWITCYILLPEQYNVADVDSATVILEDEIIADWVFADEQTQVAMAKFSRSDLQEILAESGKLGEVELTVRGELIDGTLFEGMDIIRVIDRGKK